MSKNSYDIISLDSPLLNANVKENIDTDTPFIFSRLKFYVHRIGIIIEVPLLCTPWHRFYTAHALGPPSS